MLAGISKRTSTILCSVTDDTELFILCTFSFGRVIATVYIYGKSVKRYVHYYQANITFSLTTARVGHFDAGSTS